MPGPIAPLKVGERAHELQLEREEVAPGSTAFRSIALSILAVLAVFYTLYFAASLLVPIAAAVLLSMLLAPPVQFLEGLRIPRLLASAIVVVATIGIVGAGVAVLAGPAAEWLERAPQSLHKIEERFLSFRKPIEDIQRAADHLNNSSGVKAGSEPQEVRVVRPALTDLVLSGTLQAAASTISTAILIYFLLASGDVFLRKLVTVIPTSKTKSGQSRSHVRSRRIYRFTYLASQW
jgi:predicted PurR-regulated permease PerM